MVSWWLLLQPIRMWVVKGRNVQSCTWLRRRSHTDNASYFVSPGWGDCSYTHLFLSGFIQWRFMNYMYSYEDYSLLGYCAVYCHWSSPWWWRQYALTKRRCTSALLHFAVSQKNFLLAAVGTWNLVCTSTVHRSRADPRKEFESCSNARFRERK
jgi:hypothetical protein